MCSRCKTLTDEQLYHYNFIYVKCECSGVRRVWLDPDKLSDLACSRCKSTLRRTSDPRIHRSVKRSIVLHERILPDGQVQSWAPFSADTPPPPGARVREVSSIRELERMARSGDVHDLLKFDERRLDEGLQPAPIDDEDLSEQRMIDEELQMRRDLGLSTDEAKVKESVADTFALKESI